MRKDSCQQWATSSGRIAEENGRAGGWFISHLLAFPLAVGCLHPVVATADSHVDIRTGVSRLPTLSEDQGLPGNLQGFSAEWHPASWTELRLGSQSLWCETDSCCHYFNVSIYIHTYTYAHIYVYVYTHAYTYTYNLFFSSREP